MNEYVYQLIDNPIITGLSEHSYKQILPLLVRMEIDSPFDESMTLVSTIEGIQRQIDEAPVGNLMIFIAVKNGDKTKIEYFGVEKI